MPYHLATPAYDVYSTVRGDAGQVTNKAQTNYVRKKVSRVYLIILIGAPSAIQDVILQEHRFVLYENTFLIPNYLKFSR